MAKCPHGLSRQTCLRCFHQQRQAPQPVARANDPIEEILGANLVGAPRGLVGKAALPQIGDRAGSQVGVPAAPAPVDLTARAKYRGEVGRKAAPPQDGQPAPQQAYTTSQPTGAEHNPNKVWEPPLHPSIIDRLPRHPSVEK